MPEEHLREQLWKLYEKLPEELREAIFSVETADTIDSICERNGVPKIKVSELTKKTGQVLMGLLPPNEFENALRKEAKLGAETAKNVAREVNRFIFFPLKEVLSQLYEVEIAPPARPPGAVPPAEVKSSEIPPGGKLKLEKGDIYRESVE
jgi:hypothetical protein